jgi:hypothetical protein
MYRLKALSERKVKSAEIDKFYAKVFGDATMNVNQRAKLATPLG